MKTITTSWLAAAQDDLTLIREILHNETLSHLVAFHSQQAIEKTFKAVLEEFGSFVPKMHNLETLLPKVIRYVALDIDLELLEDLDKLYIDARYPGDLGLLPDGKPNVQEATAFNELALLIYKIVSARLK
jgi:HEPN domain-containing protein